MFSLLDLKTEKVTRKYHSLQRGELSHYDDSKLEELHSS